MVGFCNRGGANEGLSKGWVLGLATEGSLARAGSTRWGEEQGLVDRLTYRCGGDDGNTVKNSMHSSLTSLSSSALVVAADEQEEENPGARVLGWRRGYL
jgi:hypothetical protein